MWETAGCLHVQTDPASRTRRYRSLGCGHRPMGRQFLEGLLLVGVSPFPQGRGHLWPLTLVAQMVKNLPAVQETRVQSLDGEDPPEKGMATHSRILAWRIPWTEEPGGLQSRGHKKWDTTEWLTHTPERSFRDVRSFEVYFYWHFWQSKNRSLETDPHLKE